MPSPPRVIRVIGDSHASLFTGLGGLAPIWPEPARACLPGVAAYRLGPFLAHSLTRPRHAARRALTSALKQARRSDPVLLVFGEIDARHHVVHQARQQGETIERFAGELARAYARAGRALVGARALAFWAAAPARDTSLEHPDFPTRGTRDERARAARAFNQALAHEAETLGARVLSIWPTVADRRGLGLEAYFDDFVHLGPPALPAAAEALIETGWVDDPAALRAAAAALAKVPVPASPPAPPPPQPAVHWPPGIANADDVRALLVDHAVWRCHARKATRIAIYGAGQHTQRMGLGPFRRRGLLVTAILDDQPRVRRMMGVPVLRPEDLTSRTDAVVISSDAHEHALAERAERVLAPRGMAVIRIYRWRD
jgi:hypothetical protein